MKKSAVILLMGLIVNIVNAQDETFALRFSQNTIGGTAKFVSLGGAYSAMGADFSAISINPAGIAVYKKSEITITPCFYVKTADATYLKNQRHDVGFNFNLNNFGFVTTINRENSRSGWVNFNFGIGYKRLNNYHSSITIEGVNTKSTLLDQYLDEANGTYYMNLDEYGAWMPFYTYLIDFDGNPDSSHYISAVPHYGENQRKTISTKGASGETVFSFGANYKDKLYVGMTIDIPSVRYTYNSNFTETDIQDTISKDTTSISDFKSFNLHEYYSTSGSGFNCKFGIIYKPANFLRLGAAIHSTTVYSLGIDYNKEMTSSFDNGDKFSDNSPEGSFNYRIITPMRAIGSVGIVFGKKGLINVEYEYVDYSKSLLRSYDYDFNEENIAIEKKYTSPSIIRAGGELNLSPYAIRAGYAFYGNPYKDGYNNVLTYVYSVGFGYRVEDFFIDFAYSLVNYSESYYMYYTKRIDTEPAKIKYTNSNFLITIGIKY
ncbi:MAG: hypothetical protein PHD97_06670 [Bacteroidales bacterium]|nr:hypothetical protein [Bacteroidales bacterium]